MSEVTVQVEVNGRASHQHQIREAAAQLKEAIDTCARVWMCRPHTINARYLGKQERRAGIKGHTPVELSYALAKQDEDRSESRRGVHGGQGVGS